MPIIIISKKKKIKNLKKEFQSPIIIDTTSKSSSKFLSLSPFYPHGDIPVPFSSNYKSKSVEGIWQGLKVFENEDIDITRFYIDTMKGLKRTVRKYGRPVGHRKGIEGIELLPYIEARKAIYIPSYEWVLKNKTNSLIKELYEVSKNNNLILLDYETNEDIYNPTKPLSHASLVKKFIENDFSLSMA